MDRIYIFEQIRENNNLLSLPQVLSEILEEVEKEDFSQESLGKIILRDAPLTTNILKVANSPFYARFKEIKTVNQAIAILGVTTVKCLALSTSVFHTDRVKKDSGMDAQEFFGYTISIAATSEKIAKTIGFKAPEEALTAGLLSDIGTIFFLHHYPKEYKKLLENSNKFTSLSESERNVFGVDHSEVGAQIALNWKLPEYILDSIKNHHSISTTEQDSVLTNIVKLASLLSVESFTECQTDIKERGEAIRLVSECLSMTKEKVDEVAFSLLSCSIELSQYLGVDIGDHEKILSKANQEIWKSYLTIENLYTERQELADKLLIEEHHRGASEQKNITMATLSHYLNNTAMAIYGRSQIMRMLHTSNKNEELIEKMDAFLNIIDEAIRKFVAVLDEMKEVSPIDKIDLHDISDALNLDDKIAKRMQKMEESQDWVVTSDIKEKA